MFEHRPGVSCSHCTVPPWSERPSSSANIHTVVTHRRPVSHDSIDRSKFEPVLV